MVMTSEENKLIFAIGLVQSQVNNVEDKLIAMDTKSTDEHRKVHDIVDALAEAVRNQTRILAEIKPLVDEYREKRIQLAEAIIETRDYQIQKAEWRGAARLAGWLYTAAGVVGGIVVVAMDKVFTWLSKVH
jgi:hypothetical protein